MKTAMHCQEIPAAVFEFYKDLGSPVAIRAIDIGLINKTFIVETSATKYILQEVSPIFETTVNEDHEAVSTHLSGHGILVPKIFRTDAGNAFVSFENRIFRALTYIVGNSFHVMGSQAMARSAGRVVGEFHRALIDFDYDYRSKRRHAGDYQFHRHNLILALREHEGHEFFKLVRPLAELMIQQIDALTIGLHTTPRHAHGDPKISNILFDEGSQGLCLVDFDTLGKTGWSLEMADAIRSWCNPHKEDELEAHVDLKLCEMALVGYGSVMRGLFTQDEAQQFIIHAEAIALCLAMRYLADTLNERYFAHDTTRFARAADHNWLRAQAMHQLYLDMGRKKNRLAEIVRDLVL